MKEYYVHGGSRTPQYYCPKCGYAHTIHSKKGKEHKKYMRTN